MRNRKTLKLFFLFNHWLSIRSFGRRVSISSLKILCESFKQVKIYCKTNITVFVLSLNKIQVELYFFWPVYMDLCRLIVKIIFHILSRHIHRSFINSDVPFLLIEIHL